MRLRKILELVQNQFESNLSSKLQARAFRLENFSVLFRQKKIDFCLSEKNKFDILGLRKWLKLQAKGPLWRTAEGTYWRTPALSLN